MGGSEVLSCGVSDQASKPFGLSICGHMLGVVSFSEAVPAIAPEAMAGTGVLFVSILSFLKTRFMACGLAKVLSLVE